MGFLAVAAGLGILLCLCGLLSFYFQPRRTAWNCRLRYIIGLMITLDYLVFWLLPMTIQGAIHKQLIEPYTSKVYKAMDTSPILRRFAETFIYVKPRHADFFATQLLFVVNFVPLISIMFYWQLKHNALPTWLLVAYNFGWVGLGARAMGAAYFMAHREGHSLTLYKPWLRNIIGNVFENVFGCFYGGVPYNFSTTHVALHHRLDAGAGDTLYCWDINRSSWPDFCMYQCRGLLHMAGFGALIQFWTSRDQVGHTRYFWLLARGCLIYWVLLPLCILGITRSPFFFFWVILQPMICMSFFLALINMGFHAFIENGDDKLRSNTVQSLTFLGGCDDFFGEDDHMAHHNQSNVFWRDLPELQKRQRGTTWAEQKASVFQGYDIFSFSITVLLKAWPLLADRYVDTTKKMTKNEIEKLLEVRATRRECPHTELLPPVPDKRVNHHPEGPPPELPEGSAFYLALHQQLTRLQFSIAKVIDMGMPPIQPTEKLDIFQPSATEAVPEGPFPEMVPNEKALNEKELKKVS